LQIPDFGCKLFKTRQNIEIFTTKERYWTVTWS